MNRMFKTAIAFNKDISGWNVLKVETMGEMFCEASTFNHFVGGWTENSALTSTNMFQGALRLFWKSIPLPRVASAQNRASVAFL